MCQYNLLGYSNAMAECSSEHLTTEGSRQRRGRSAGVRRGFARKAKEADSWESASLALLLQFVTRIQLRTEVDADVKAGVIPIGMMITAPLAVGVHTVYVAIDLAAAIAMTSGVAINAGAIVFEALVAGVRVIRFGADWSADGEEQAAG
jgi:hypothetical protein